nr:hypothetical protein [Tanacetum cinerariifolium]
MIKECSSCGALYNKSCGCSKESFVDKFICDPNKTHDSSQRPPHNCLKCENPVDGLYCRQCALLRKILKEVWFTICDEHQNFQDFLNTSESSNDNTNVVNAPQEPFVFNQDPDKNSSQSPPHIDHHCCYGCGDSLDGIFCHQCTCESCGNGAHYGYNCLPKVSIISNPKPFHNQNVDEFPQTLPSFRPTCYYGDENSFAYDSNPNFVDDSPNDFNPPSQPSTDSYKFCGNDAHYSHDSVGARIRPFNKFKRFSFFKTPKVLLLAWDRVSKIKDAFRNKQYKPEDIQELICKLFNDVQNIHEELAEYINTLSWNRPAFYNHDDDDDEDYTVAITPVLSTQEPGIPDNMCDVLFRDNSSPLDISKDQFEDFFDSNDDSTSIDDAYFSIDDIDYVKASPPDFELVSLEEIENDILRENLLNIHLLIAKIKSLNDNPTPDHVLKSPSPFPIPVEDSDSFFEKTDTSLSCSDNSLPEFETFSNHTEETSSGNILGEPRVPVPNVLPTHPTIFLDTNFTLSDNSLPECELFCFDIKEKNSGSTTIYADISPSEFEHFHFKIEPDPGELTSIVDSEIRENVLSATNVNLSPEDDQSPLFAYVV